MVTAEQAQLYREAEHLTEALGERVRGGDHAGGQALIKRRDEVLRKIQDIGASSVAPSGAGVDDDRHARESAASIQRMIVLNEELLTALKREQDRVRLELTELGQRRQSLASYRGPRAISPSFVDRRG